MKAVKRTENLADRINDLLKPKELAEEVDENEAKLEKYDEHVVINELSSIRHQNSKQLSEIDSKYKGKVVSRKEIEDEYGESSGDDEFLSDENLLSESSEDEKSSEEDMSGSDEDMTGSNDSQFSDDYDISQFIGKPQTSKNTTNIEQEDSTVLVNKKSSNEEVKKGICVQNQLKMWEKLLEVRIKAQKMLITANSFPNFDSFLDLTSEAEFSEKIEETCDGIYGLLDNLLDMQNKLVGSFPESSNIFKSSSKRKTTDTSTSSIMKKSKLSEYSEKIQQNHESYKDFRNQTLQKWHDRTKNLKDSKNPLTNLSIITKIENALLGKHEIIRKSQIYRGDYEIYGLEMPQKHNESNDELCLAEIYDDSDFYHQLLRELIEYKSNFGDNQSEITQKFIELQNVRSRMKKRVETRTSKGRKIRYNVHNKLVNFMPPKDDSEWTEEAKTELFNSLFGRATTSEV